MFQTSVGQGRLGCKKGEGWDFAATLLALLLHARAERPSHCTDTALYMILALRSLCATKESKDWEIHSDEIHQIFRVAIRLATQEPRMCKDTLVFSLIWPSLTRVCAFVCSDGSASEICVCA